jgi:2-dehydropantoate 2-reductase
LITIVGAGSIGLSLGGRLARAGSDVVFLTRRAEAAATLTDRALSVTDPSVQESTFTVRVRAHHRIEDLPDSHRRGVVVLCTRVTELESAAGAVARAMPDALVVCAQNDVGNEARVATRARRVAGLVYRQTCTRQDDATVFALGPGRIVVGLHPTGSDPDLDRLADAAERAGYDVGRSAEIARDKWLKLCVNLMSTPNALVRREDHTTEAFVEVKARLLEEAAAVLDAAGIVAEPCDAGDRSLSEEIASQRASLAAGTSARLLPVYNAVWSALRDPALGLEADVFHRRIIELGARHDVATPVNRRSLAALLRARTEGRGPESVSAGDLLPCDERP